MIPSLQKIRKERSERSLVEYTKDAWKVLEPLTPYQHNWHVDAICEYLQAVKLGQIKRLLINMPPRLLKTYLVTIVYPTWDWIDTPHRRFINLSYSGDLSKEHNVKKRDLITSHWYQTNWEESYKIKDDVNTQRLFENNKTGSMFATSVGGTITGKGGDVIIFDDPHNPKQAESDTERQSAINFYKGTLQTRLNNPETGCIIVVMQRLHDQDLSGHIISTGAEYEHLCLPMTAPEKTTIVMPITLKEIIREKGDILHPDRFSKDYLKNLKLEMGSYSYDAQYEQNPGQSGGGTAERWWWRYWQHEGMDLPPVPVKNEKGETIFINPVTLPNDCQEEAQSWDLNFKSKAAAKGKDPDPVGVGIWRRKGANRYLIHRDIQQIGFNDTLKLFRRLTAAYPKAKRKLVEDKANGPAVMDTLKDEISGIIPYDPGSDSKVARAQAVTPQIESGNVYLPHPHLAKWVDDYIECWAKFPKVPHDEDVDQTSQILTYWGSKKPKFRATVV